MALLIDLPSPLDEDLAVEAKREGVSASEQATLFLQIMTALTREGRKTPFRSAVKAYLQKNSFDADRLADVVEGLMEFCLHESAPSSTSTDQDCASSNDRIGSEQALDFLRGWRNPAVHCSIDHDVEISASEFPPPERLIQRAGRMNRVSALGKYAHLDLSTERMQREKQQEIDREDRI